MIKKVIITIDAEQDKIDYLNYIDYCDCNVKPKYKSTFVTGFGQDNNK